MGGLLISALKQKPGKDGKPTPLTVGQTKLAALLKEGCEIGVVNLKPGNIKAFKKAAKKLKVHYAAVKDNKTGHCDIVYRYSDAAILQIALDRIGYKAVDAQAPPAEAPDPEDSHTQGNLPGSELERPENGLTPILPEGESPVQGERPQMPSLFPRSSNPQGEPEIEGDADPEGPPRDDGDFYSLDGLDDPDEPDYTPDSREHMPALDADWPMPVHELLNTARHMSQAAPGTAHEAPPKPSVRERMQNCIARARSQGQHQQTRHRPPMKG